MTITQAEILVELRALAWAKVKDGVSDPAEAVEMAAVELLYRERLPSAPDVEPGVVAPWADAARAIDDALASLPADGLDPSEGLAHALTLVGFEDWGHVARCARKGHHVAIELLCRRLPSGDAPQEPSDLDGVVALLTAHAATCTRGSPTWLMCEQAKAMLGEVSRPPGGAEPEKREAIEQAAAVLRAHLVMHTTQWAAMDTLLDVALGCGRWRASAGAPGTAEPSELLKEVGSIEDIISEPYVGATLANDIGDHLHEIRRLTSEGAPGGTEPAGPSWEVVRSAVFDYWADNRMEPMAEAWDRMGRTDRTEFAKGLARRIGASEGAAPPPQPLDRNYIGSMSGSMGLDAAHATSPHDRAVLQDYADRLTRIAGGDDTQPTSARHSWPVEPAELDDLGRHRSYGQALTPEPSGVPDAPGMSLHKLYSVALTRAATSEERYGQALYNTLREVRPDIAARLTGTADPFNAGAGDERLRRAVEVIESMWGGWCTPDAIDPKSIEAAAAEVVHQWDLHKVHGYGVDKARGLVASNLRSKLRCTPDADAGLRDQLLDITPHVESLRDALSERRGHALMHESAKFICKLLRAALEVQS